MVKLVKPSFVERASGVELASCQFQYIIGRASCRGMGILRGTGILPVSIYYRAGIRCGTGILRGTGILPVSIYYQAGRMPNLLLFMGRFSNALSIALVTYPVQ
ncbi:hypothetical protein [Moorena sp. SIO4G3]|uniref:hypothetical protein n=1 Tax=Moorena sp. SIO4G3 TaxID=2607821 RepID=UPI00142A77C1|nr:hypothetical protein [Moorena sp. SIO4G3]NEO75243.1 hypothetical protein [Moorena sp. SIO4G3]